MEPKSYGKATAADLDAIFAALADTTRRALLAQLAKGEASVFELAAPFAITQPAISKHLKVLEGAGLITRDRDAQKRPSRLNAAPLAAAKSWLADYERFMKPQASGKDDAADSLKPAKKKKKKDKSKQKKMR